MPLWFADNWDSPLMVSYESCISQMNLVSNCLAHIKKIGFCTNSDLRTQGYLVKTDVCNT